MFESVGAEGGKEKGLYGEECWYSKENVDFCGISRIPTSFNQEKRKQLIPKPHALIHLYYISSFHSSLCLYHHKTTSARRPLFGIKFSCLYIIISSKEGTTRRNANNQKKWWDASRPSVRSSARWEISSSFYFIWDLSNRRVPTLTALYKIVMDGCFDRLRGSTVGFGKRQTLKAGPTSEDILTKHCLQHSFPCWRHEKMSSIF